jgi:L-ribulose-5-phosphate 4-epimerase
MTMASIKELKEKVYEANMELFHRGLVLYTFGNVSGFDKSRGLFAIKPSGVPYDKLSPADMVVMNLKNKIIEGKQKPSTDAPTHAVLYRKFTGIGGIAHTHSTHATAFAQAKREIPCLGTTHADFLPCAVPCTKALKSEKIRDKYEEATGEAIADRFVKLSWLEVPMVLVASHGPFTWGEDAEKAIYHSVVLEELARMASLALCLNPTIPEIPLELIDKHFRRKHGEDAYYGQEK